MTAFARQDLHAEWGSALCELRSVNNRHLDVAMRLPEDLRFLEPAIRARVGKRLKRGKVDCTFRWAFNPANEAALTIDLALAGRLVSAGHEVGALIDAPAAVDPMDILRWPGVIQSAAPDQELIQHTAMPLLDTALDELIATREREGAKIGELLAARCDDIESIVAMTRVQLPEVVKAHRERLLSRLADVREQLDEARLEQEMVLVAQKIDISEELDRLDAHVAEVRRVLGESIPVGRRLDFLMQEMNREANTLGSKSASTATTRAAVDLKVFIEQMREQIQNVE